MSSRLNPKQTEIYPANKKYELIKTFEKDFSCLLIIVYTQTSCSFRCHLNFWLKIKYSEYFYLLRVVRLCSEGSDERRPSLTVHTVYRAIAGWYFFWKDRFLHIRYLPSLSLISNFWADFFKSRSPITKTNANTNIWPWNGFGSQCS